MQRQRLNSRIENLTKFPSSARFRSEKAGLTARLSPVVPLVAPRRGRWDHDDDLMPNVELGTLNKRGASRM